MTARWLCACLTATLVSPGFAAQETAKPEDRFIELTSQAAK